MGLMNSRFRVPGFGSKRKSSSPNIVTSANQPSNHLLPHQFTRHAEHAGSPTKLHLQQQRSPSDESHASRSPASGGASPASDQYRCLPTRTSGPGRRSTTTAIRGRLPGGSWGAWRTCATIARTIWTRRCGRGRRGGQKQSSAHRGHRFCKHIVWIATSVRG